MRAPVRLGARLGGASRYLTALVEQGLFSLEQAHARFIHAHRRAR